MHFGHKGLKHLVQASLLVGALLATLPALAQTGQISGVAKDPHGALVAKATVQITNQETTHKTTVKTDASGSYTATNLAAGHYVVVVSAPGFATFTSAILTIADGQPSSYDVQLKVGPAHSFVNVEGLKEGSVELGYKPTTANTTGPWDTLPIQNTPYSINVMSADLIENLNITSVDDFYRVDPVIQQNLTSRYFVNSDGEELRGFQQNPATGGRFEDGMRSSWAPPAFEDVDRVEVITGLTGFLYGANHVGGMINYVTKKPTDAPLGNLTIGSQGDAVLWHADLGGPITKNDKFGYRLNMATQNAPAGIDGISRQLGTLNLDWHARKNLFADFGYSYQRTTVLGTAPTWWGLTNWNFVPNQSKYWGQPWATGTDTVFKYTPKVVWNISDKLTFRTGYQYVIDKQSYGYVYPMISVGSTGSFTETLYNCPPSNNFTNAGYSFIDYKFKTSFLEHKVTAGWSGDNMENKIPMGLGANWVTVTGTIANGPGSIPNPKLPLKNYLTSGSNYWAKYGVDKAYNWQIGDEITVGKKAEVLLGINRATVGEASYNWETGIAAINGIYDRSAWTPSASLVYKPIERLSTYFTYIQGLQEGLVVPQNTLCAPGNTTCTWYTDGGKVFDAQIDRQYEIGAKMTAGKVLLTAALYQIAKANTYQTSVITVANGVTTTTIDEEQNGQQRNRGIEFTATGKITRDLLIVGGLNIINPSVQKATPSASNPNPDGKLATNVAEHMYKVHAEYNIPKVKGFTLSAGTNYTGKRYENAINTLIMPDYNLVDLGARYKTDLKGRAVTFRVYATNVTNKAYWLNASETGMPTVVSASMEISLFRRE